MLFMIASEKPAVAKKAIARPKIVSKVVLFIAYVLIALSLWQRVGVRA